MNRLHFGLFIGNFLITVWLVTSLGDANFWMWMVGILSIVVSIVLAKKQNSLSKKFVFWAIVLVIITINLAAARAGWAAAHPARAALDNLVGQKVVLTGMIDEFPDERFGGTHLIIKVKNEDQISTRVLVRAPMYPRYMYGDWVEVEAKLEKPDNFATDTGREFDYQNYLGVSNIYYVMSFAQVKSLDKNDGNFVKFNLQKVRNATLDAIKTSLHEPYGALLGGILLGDKSGLGRDLQDQYRTAGLIHIVVLSGYNVTIVALFFVRAFSRFGFKTGLVAGSLSIVLFAIITGGQATVMRASVMALIAIIATATGNKYTIGRSLAVAAVFMVFINPIILVHDVSFQLSFMATLGLLYIAPILDKWYTTYINISSKFATKIALQENTVATIATQIAVLPLLIYTTGQTSLVSVPVNIIVLFTIPWVMATGGMLVLFVWMLPFASALLIVPTHALLAWQVRVVSTVAGWQFAEVSLPAMSGWMVAVLYVLLSVLIWWCTQKFKVSDNKLATYIWR